MLQQIFKLVVVSSARFFLHILFPHNTIYWWHICTKFYNPVHCRRFDLWSGGASHFSLSFCCYFWFYLSPRGSCHMREGLEEEKERERLRERETERERERESERDFQECKIWSILSFCLLFWEKPPNRVFTMATDKGQTRLLKKAHALFRLVFFLFHCQSFIGRKHECVFGYNHSAYLDTSDATRDKTK